MAEVEPQQIGPYIVTELLQVYSTSTFYLVQYPHSRSNKEISPLLDFATGKQHKQKLVIKRFNNPLTTAEARIAFLRHAKQLKKLRSRNIINTIDANFDGDYAYLVMEHVTGETWQQSIPTGMQLTPDEVKRILTPIAGALQYAHVNNIVHGNLHPGNLLRDRDHNTLLTDFALALPGSPLVLGDEAAAIPYMAPEYLRGQPTFASDQYSLAVIAYEWLCGRRPYEATERDSLLKMQEQQEFPPPHKLNNTISPIVGDVLRQALARDAAERFSSTQAFADLYLGALARFPPQMSQPAAAAPPPNDKSSNCPTNISSSKRATAPPTPALPAPSDKIHTSKHEESTITTDLCQGGILSQSLPGYEERQAQIEMAQTVSHALTQNVPAIIEAGTGTGKALAVETPIPTPTGWKHMGDLIAGDFVFDEEGSPTRIIAAFDVMYNRTCYEVVFSDGSSLIADAEHEWPSYPCPAPRSASHSQHFVAANQLGDRRSYTLITTEQMAVTLSTEHANYAIAVASTLVLPEADLPIDPYVLGTWLGDSRDFKHIPMIYLRASEQQRRALLAGLLATDSTVKRCDAVELTLTSPQLAQDAYELLCTLGLQPSLSQQGKKSSPQWTLTFTSSEQLNNFRHVSAVRKVPSYAVRCIQVESPSHLYLAGRSMIPTHNSLAYLVPLVRSGKVAIVSTANKTLQEQLFYKDIPFVQQHIKDFEAALVKGVSNYLCLDRMENERVGMQFHTRDRTFTRLLKVIDDPHTTFRGDFETLGFRLPADIRGRIATDSDQCAWSKCDYFAHCYVRQMRERAQMAQIIVVNHTLLLLDAAMDGFLLPDRDVIVLDEAHHLEEEATRSFTITINPMQIQTLLAQRLLKDYSLVSLQSEASKTAESLWMRLTEVANPGTRGRAILEAPLQEGLHLATVISDLADSLRKRRPKDQAEKETQLYDKLVKRTQNLSENIRTVFSIAECKNFVYYVEYAEGARSGSMLQASAAPLDITGWLKERLFDKCNVICTSATLATISTSSSGPEDRSSNFSYFRRRVGLDPIERPDVLERILPLAFDYESNALLYLPRDLPQPAFGPRSDDYMKSIAREMYRLVKISHGRAFLLFSSKRMLDRAYDLMSPHLSFPLLKQGDMTRMELTRRFRKEEGAVLFGLKSFWEGVDIAGDALSLVVIDKLPFDPLDDPVHEARIAQMKAAGENWFGSYVLPQAVLRLKQGLGRLLRTRDDRGVMAILDTRLHTKGYGKLVLNALPPARRTSNIQDVERFFTKEL